MYVLITSMQHVPSACCREALPLKNKIPAGAIEKPSTREDVYGVWIHQGNIYAILKIEEIEV